MREQTIGVYQGDVNFGSAVNNGEVLLETYTTLPRMLTTSLYHCAVLDSAMIDEYILTIRRIIIMLRCMTYLNVLVHIGLSREGNVAVGMELLAA